MSKLIELFEREQMKAEIPAFNPGDTVVVRVKVKEGERERLPNPTMAVTDGNVTVKFHPWTIEEIVASEQAV